MDLRILSNVAGGVLLIVSLSGCAAISAHHRAFVNEHVRHGSAARDDVSISGEWKVTFYVHEMKTPATFNFKLDGSTVTGTAYSDHTGQGTIRDGKWADGKLSLTLVFAKHESIVVTGALKDGKFVGEFKTEGFTDRWEAVRK